VATCRPQDAEWCRRAGAAEVLDYRDERLAELLRRAAPDGVDVHVDTSGTLDLDLAVGTLARRGRIVVLAGRGRRPGLPAWDLYTRGGRIVGFVISDAGVDELAAAAKAINHHLAMGGLTARIAAVLPLEQAAEAHRMVERRVRGRVVVRP
jgi:NADPH:quinone reductase-like Zn-dependent oxidoreductase